MPLISVIIPTHNGTTRFLDQALDSVFGQTYSDWELIIVDDASTDDTAAYVQDRLRSCDHPVEYIQRSVNGGPSAARNDGARVATGTFLAFWIRMIFGLPLFSKKRWPCYSTRHKKWVPLIRIGGTLTPKDNGANTSRRISRAFAIRR